MKITVFKLTMAKKRISPILATLLLIVMAVTAITVTYAWIMTCTEDSASNVDVVLYEANVNFLNGTTKSITVDVGNSGTSSAKIIAIYVGNSSTALVSQNIESHLVSAGSIYSFNVPYDNWVSGKTYYFKVVSSSGEPLTFSHEVP